MSHDIQGQIKRLQRTNENLARELIFHLEDEMKPLPSEHRRVLQDRIRALRTYLPEQSPPPGETVDVHA